MASRSAQSSLRTGSALWKHLVDAAVVALAVWLLVFAALGKREPIGGTIVTSLATPPPLANLRAMTLLPGSTQYTLDAVTQEGSVPIVLANGPRFVDIFAHRATTLSGWAVDAPAHGSADAVYVRLDGGIVTSCHIGSLRNDVASAYHAIAYAVSGFTCTIAADRIAAGRHEMEIDIVVRGDRAYYAAKSPTAFVAR